MLDLRKPAGFFFALLGIILCGVGLAANFTAPLLESNLNLHFGIVAIAFGGAFLWLARRS